MQSPSLAAGTGMLQDDPFEAGNDIDLDAIDEILSQHSNKTSHAHHASQVASAAVDMASPGVNAITSGNTCSQDEIHSATSFQSLAPAGPDSSDVIDLACIPEPSPRRRSLLPDRPLHPRATRIVPSVTPTSSKQHEHDADTQHGTSNR